jgi:hypothetical protein
MKTKLFILSALLGLTTTGSLLAQTTIEGSPYLSEAYTTADIWSSATSHQKYDVRYNIYQDAMEYKQNGQAFVFDPSSKVRRVVLPEETFVILRYELDGKMSTGFLEVLDSGRVMLYAKKMVKFNDIKKGGNLDGTDQPARYARLSDVFLFRIGNTPPKEIENLKGMIAAFPDKNEELTAFAKKEKISVKKEKDVIKLVKFYDGLFEE